MSDEERTYDAAHLELCRAVAAAIIAAQRAGISETSITSAIASVAATGA